MSKLWNRNVCVLSDYTDNNTDTRSMLCRVSSMCGSIGKYCENGLYSQKVVDVFLGDFRMTPISQEQDYVGVFFLTEPHHEDLKRNDDE